MKCVEDGKLPRMQCEKIPNIFLIADGCALRLQLGLDPANIALRQPGPSEQMLVGHAVIAVSMAWWHCSFIYPEDMDEIPVEICFNHFAEHQLWRRTTGDRQRGAPSDFNRGLQVGD
ncbi:MAG: hypothetical protein WKF37_02360 [Bryobacteraceae bacterium]